MSVHARHHHNVYEQLLPFAIVLAGLVVGTYLFFYLSTVEASVQSSLNSNLSPQSAIIPALQEEDKETEPEIDAELKQLLSDFEENQSATMGITVLPLDGSTMVGVNETTTFKAASMYKLFVAYETLLQVDEGKLSLDQATGYEAGSRSIGSCLDIMISISDNDCGRALRKVIDVTEKPLPRLAELGFTGTNLAYDYPTTSAQDIALLYNKLYNQEDLSKSSNQLLLSYLKNQKVNDRIPRGLPNDTEIAHKTGDLEGFAHDGGIIYTRSGDYVLVIMGGPWTENLGTVYATYANLTSLVHDHLTGS